jgi:uncharacterized protein YjbI with pentapeptide repeats
MAPIDLQFFPRLSACRPQAAAGGACPHLRGADLRRCNLAGADFEGSNLRAANLRGGDLTRMKLLDANLFDADLAGACWSRCFASEGASWNVERRA